MKKKYNRLTDALRDMFKNVPEIQEGIVVGNRIYSKLNDDLKISFEIITTGIGNHYDTVSLSIINPRSSCGTVDKIFINFLTIFRDSDYYIWNYSGLAWYKMPDSLLVKELEQEIRNFIEIYR